MPVLTTYQYRPYGEVAPYGTRSARAQLKPLKRKKARSGNHGRTPAAAVAAPALVVSEVPTQSQRITDLVNVTHVADPARVVAQYDT